MSENKVKALIRERLNACEKDRLVDILTEYIYTNVCHCRVNTVEDRQEVKEVVDWDKVLNNIVQGYDRRNHCIELTKCYKPIEQLTTNNKLSELANWRTNPAFHTSKEKPDYSKSKEEVLAVHEIMGHTVGATMTADLVSPLTCDGWAYLKDLVKEE